MSSPRMVSATGSVVRSFDQLALYQALRKNIDTKESQVPAFHRIFLKTVRMFGRVHELTLIGLYKMKTRTFFSDMKLGREMFLRGRIHLLPYRSPRSGEVKKLFKKASAT